MGNVAYGREKAGWGVRLGASAAALLGEDVGTPAQKVAPCREPSAVCVSPSPMSSDWLQLCFPPPSHSMSGKGVCL